MFSHKIDEHAELRLIELRRAEELNARLCTKTGKWWDHLQFVVCRDQG